MRVQVAKWGNSLAVRIPKPFAEEVGVEAGTVVDLSVSEGRLIAVPVGPPMMDLAELLAGVTDDNLHGEWDVGAAMGREVW